MSPFLKKALSVAVGMVGLAVIGLVSGTPKNGRVELLSVSPALGDAWLAGSAEDTEPLASASAARVESAQRDSVEPNASASSAEPAPPPSGTGSAAGVTADGKVVLNLATASELTRLPGVGQKRADKIVELRQRLGRFKKLTDLLRIKGIGPKSLRKMLPYLLLDPPTENRGGASNG